MHIAYVLQSKFASPLSEAVRKGAHQCRLQCVSWHFHPGCLRQPFGQRCHHTCGQSWSAFRALPCAAPAAMSTSRAILQVCACARRAHVPDGGSLEAGGMPRCRELKGGGAVSQGPSSAPALPGARPPPPRGSAMRMSRGPPQCGLRTNAKAKASSQAQGKGSPRRPSERGREAGREALRRGGRGAPRARLRARRSGKEASYVHAGGAACVGGGRGARGPHSQRASRAPLVCFGRCARVAPRCGRSTRQDYAYGYAHGSVADGGRCAANARARLPRLPPSCAPRLVRARVCPARPCTRSLTRPPLLPRPLWPRPSGVRAVPEEPRDVRADGRGAGDAPAEHRADAERRGHGAAPASVAGQRTEVSARDGAVSARVWGAWRVGGRIAAGDARRRAPIDPPPAPRPKMAPRDNPPPSAPNSLH